MAGQLPPTRTGTKSSYSRKCCLEFAGSRAITARSCCVKMGDGSRIPNCKLFRLDGHGALGGEDCEVAVVPPYARKLLSRFDERSRHYETILNPRVVSEVMNRSDVRHSAA